MTVFHQSSPVDSVTLCSKNYTLNNIFSFIFETTTTFMRSDETQKRNNGVIHHKQIRAMIQVLVSLKARNALV